MSDQIEIPRSWVDKRREEIQGRITSLESKIEDIKEDIRELRVERNILNRWVERFENGARPSGHEPQESAPSLPKPSKAVDRFFAENPGTTKEDAADMILQRGVRSSAQDPRGVVLTAIRRRVHDGKLWADEDDRLWPADHPRAMEIAAAEARGEGGQTRFGPKVTGD